MTSSELPVSAIYKLPSKTGAYTRGGGGGAQGASAPPPPTLEKSSAQKCSKEERKFHPDMSAKKNVHVPLRYDKINTKNVGKKEDIRPHKKKFSLSSPPSSGFLAASIFFLNLFT